jgi:hypothetical protein
LAKYLSHFGRLAPHSPKTDGGTSPRHLSWSLPITMEFKMMAFTKLAAGAALATLLVSAAHAQNVGVGVGPAGVGITFSPEQRTVVREYVQRQRPIELRERVVVGAKLPADVEIREVPDAWGPSVSRYRYVYTGGNVYFVEPSSRRVIHVLD